MFFVVSKLLGLIFEPVNFIVLALVAGVLLGSRGHVRVGRALIRIAVLVLLIASFSPLSSLLTRVLEDRFPRPAADMPEPAGIIVLGGSVDQEVSASRGEIALNHAAGRLTAAVALARRYPQARLIFTGGPSDIRGLGRDEADEVHRFWLSLGVPGSRMAFENRSRNTFENAIYTRDLASPKPGEVWLLVTSAAHMPRSTGIFRHAGFPVTPYPVDYQTFGDVRDWQFAFSGLRSLDRLEIALHEWFGLAAYWLTDKTDALFPGP